MSDSNVTKFFKSVQASMVKHSPEILTGIGIAGMITTTILAVKATPKALRICESLKEEREEEPTKLEYAKAAWKCYIPAAVTGVASTVCLIGASSVHAKRNAVLATAYKLSETALSEYKEKVVEVVGEKKERAIREKIAADHAEQTPVTKQTVIITDKGNSLCFDHVFGRYFKSDRDEIERAVTRLNREIIIEGYASLNVFYGFLGLSLTDIGDDLGWRIDDGEIKIEYGTTMADDGTPCITIEYNIMPKANYNRYL